MAVSGAEAVEDFLGGEAAALTAEKLDDGASSTPVSMSFGVERGDSRLGPRRRVGRSAHGH